MPMSPATFHESSRVFLEAVGPGPQARPLIGYQLQLDTELLPEPDPQCWMVSGRGADTALLLLAQDVLFTLTREDVPDHDRQIIVASHPVEITEIRYWRDDLETSWQFQFRDRDELRIAGRIVRRRIHPDDSETFDRAEMFARALAKRVRWDVGA